MRRLDGITHSADMTLSSCRSQRRPGQPGLLQPMGRKEPADLATEHHQSCPPGCRVALAVHVALTERA